MTVRIVVSDPVVMLETYRWEVDIPDDIWERGCDAVNDYVYNVERIRDRDADETDYTCLDAGPIEFERIDVSVP